MIEVSYVERRRIQLGVLAQQTGPDQLPAFTFDCLEFDSKPIHVRSGLRRLIDQPRRKRPLQGLRQGTVFCQCLPDLVSEFMGINIDRPRRTKTPTRTTEVLFGKRTREPLHVDEANRNLLLQIAEPPGHPDSCFHPGWKFMAMPLHDVLEAEGLIALQVHPEIRPDPLQPRNPFLYETERKFVGRYFLQDERFFGTVLPERHAHFGGRLPAAGGRRHPFGRENPPVVESHADFTKRHPGETPELPIEQEVDDPQDRGFSEAVGRNHDRHPLVLVEDDPVIESTEKAAYLDLGKCHGASVRERTRPSRRRRRISSRAQVRFRGCRASCAWIGTFVSRNSRPPMQFLTRVYGLCER